MLQDWFQYLTGLPADVGAIPLLLCATKPDLPGARPCPLQLCTASLSTLLIATCHSYPCLTFFTASAACGPQWPSALICSISDLDCIQHSHDDVLCLPDISARHGHAGKGGMLNYGPYYSRFPYIFPNITNINPYASQKPQGPYATDAPTARRLFDESVKIINEKVPANQSVSVLQPRD